MKYKRRASFEAELVQLALLITVPNLLGLILLLYSGYSYWLSALIILSATLLVFSGIYRIYHKTVFQIRSLSNLLEAMINGDFSLRARSQADQGALTELIDSINGLADKLSEQRTTTYESQFLLHTVITHIDVAILAVSEDGQLRFYNPAADKLFKVSSIDQNQLLDQLQPLLTFENGHNRLFEMELGKINGRFNIHIEHFREQGRPHKLLFITDVREILRNEERRAWQSLVRVISHEINNSLSPIASLSQTLAKLIDQEDFTNKPDFVNGLDIIRSRTTNLTGFVNSYKQLTKLPEPSLTAHPLRDFISQICSLFADIRIEILSQDNPMVMFDKPQLEQVLINILKNAKESMELVKGRSVSPISISWTIDSDTLRIEILDNGVGIANECNLFVPFFSTKNHGSGIGLVLSRQILEAHKGTIDIKNANNQTGCLAILRLPA